MNEARAAGGDLFTDGPGRRALSAGPAAQRWFFDGVLAATAHHADPRLAAVRGPLTAEIARFGRLSAGLPDGAAGEGDR
jgi:hypothetical protein